MIVNEMEFDEPKSVRCRVPTTYKLVIAGRLPTLNEYIKLERGNRYAAAKEKKKTEDKIILLCRMQLRGVTVDKPVIMRYLWVEKDKRRDRDNIVFARKFIQDALVKCGVLANDGWNEIAGFEDDFKVDAKNPRIEVIIEEV